MWRCAYIVSAYNIAW